MTSSIFKGQPIYIGLDVHKSSWDVQILTEHTVQRGVHKHDPNVTSLVDYLHRRYPGGDYQCVYEAGFSGFWIQEQLQNLGVATIVVHPLDVPTTDKDRRFKTDRIDSKKLAMSLRSGQLEGIHIPGKQRQQERSLVRQRYQFVCDQRRIQNRITAHLYFYGIQLDQKKSNSHWSARYISSLEQFSEQHSDIVLQGYLDKLRVERKFASEALRKLRDLSKSPRYAEQVSLLRSIPGVGLLTTMVYLTEIGDINRFKSDDAYISYLGLTPSRRSSGQKDYIGRMSKRGNTRVRTALILSAWRTVANDPKMAAYYEQYKKQGKTSNKAIVKIAKKLALVIKAVLRDKTKYKI